MKSYKAYIEAMISPYILGCKDQTAKDLAPLRVGGGRNSALDFGAGCMMLIVIFLHAGVLQSKPFTIMHVFGFFMPWFFFKAGMFHKKDQHYSKEFFIKLLKRFVLPMCTYYVISRGGFTGLLWFVEALMISRIVFVLLPKHTLFLVVFSLSLFLIGYYVNREEPSLPLLLKEIPMALFYYTIGFLLKDVKLDLKWVGYLVIVYLLILILIPSRVDMRMQTILFGSFEIAVAGCIVGIVLMNAVFELCKKYLIKPIIYIGRESMSYYILNMPIISFLQHYQSFYQSELIPALSVLLIVPIVIILTDKMRLSFLLGKS